MLFRYTVAIQRVSKAREKAHATVIASYRIPCLATSANINNVHVASALGQCFQPRKRMQMFQAGGELLLLAGKVA